MFHATHESACDKNIYRCTTTNPISDFSKYLLCSFASKGHMNQAVEIFQVIHGDFKPATNEIIKKETQRNSKRAGF